MKELSIHTSPLLNGHAKYESLPLATRKKLLASFRVFLRNTPFKYHCIKIKVSKDASVEFISSKMRQQLIDFIFVHLVYFQGFDCVKIYYDNGQKSVANAIHKAMDYALAKNVVTYRLASPEDYRLSQVADYICTMELTALKYEESRATATDEKFFGSYRQFKKGILKELRAKQF